jgi:sensor histidine kinase regulating citrate/malate metabolism
MNNNKKNYIHTINIVGYSFLVFILILGIVKTNTVEKQMGEREMKNLLIRTEMVANMVDVKKIKALEGNESDINKEEYKDLKKSFEKIVNINKDVRFAYIMGLKNDKQYFMIDGEIETSEDFSPPGQIYKDANEQDIYNHKNGISYTRGPYNDAWGKWFSAYSPVIDENKNILGIVGMDIDAKTLLLRVKIVKEGVMLISSLIFLSALLFFLLIKKTLKQP